MTGEASILSSGEARKSVPALRSALALLSGEVLGSGQARESGSATPELELVAEEGFALERRGRYSRPCRPRPHPRPRPRLRLRHLQ